MNAAVRDCLSIQHSTSTQVPNTHSMTNRPAEIQHLTAAPNPSLLSFQSTTVSPSETSTSPTATSSSTILGIGSLSGKAFVASGKAVLRNTHSMTNRLAEIQYPTATQNPSLLSFQSTTAPSSETSTSQTATSSGTILGIGSLTGKALVAFGKAVLRSASAVVIQTRLQTLKPYFPHGDRYESPDIPIVYRDVLELSRYVRALQFGLVWLP